jgi:hypothetical protein
VPQITGLLEATQFLTPAHPLAAEAAERQLPQTTTDETAVLVAVQRCLAHLLPVLAGQEIRGHILHRKETMAGMAMWEAVQTLTQPVAAVAAPMEWVSMGPWPLGEMAGQELQTVSRALR